MRKAFNFYRSYYDVAKELSEKERLSFLWALLERQFDGKEPILTGMSKFAYISQQHSIDSQVIGYEVKTGEKVGGTQGGSVGGMAGGTQGGSVQGEGKGKGKVQEEGKEEKEESFRSFKHLRILVSENEKILKLGYSQEQINSVYDSIENYKKNTNYSSLYLTTLKWIKKEFPKVEATQKREVLNIDMDLKYGNDND